MQTDRRILPFAHLVVLFFALAAPHAHSFSRLPFLPSSMHLHKSKTPLPPSVTTSSPSNPQNSDLWVVGCGRLGVLVAKKWLELHPAAVVVGETMSTANHEDIARIGAIPRLRSERQLCDISSAKRVLVSLPPYSRRPETAQLYLGEVMAAVDLPHSLSESAQCILDNDNLDFACTNQMHHVLLISSSSVYGSPSNLEDQIVTETTPTVRRDNPDFMRASSTIAAEEAVLGCNYGSVMRLAGLYDRFRGPHSYWLSMIEKLNTGENTTSSLNIVDEALVNLVHYEDAADAVVKALTRAKPGGVYLASDGNPISRRDIIEAAVKSQVRPGVTLPQDSVLYSAKNTTTYSKMCDSSWTRHILDWAPRYTRFDEYMRASH